MWCSFAKNNNDKKKNWITFHISTKCFPVFSHRLLFTCKTSNQFSLCCCCGQESSRPWKQDREEERQYNQIKQNKIWCRLYTALEQGHCSKTFFLVVAIRRCSVWLINEASSLWSVTKCWAEERSYANNWGKKDETQTKKEKPTEGRNSKVNLQRREAWTRLSPTSRWDKRNRRCWHSTFFYKILFPDGPFLLWWVLHLPAGRQRDTILFHPPVKWWTQHFPEALSSATR